MKRCIISACLIMVCSLVFAQVKVGSDGKVAIGTDTAAPLSILSVNSKGEADSDIIIESTNSMALTAIHNPTERSTGWARGCNTGIALSPHTFNVGTLGSAYSHSALSSGRGFGLFGTAGNYTSGYNYGVLGMLYGTNNGAGIYGTSVHSDYGVPINGRYAGYFRGNVYVTGSIYSVLLTPATTSTNLSTLSAQSESEEGTMTKLSRLNTVQYNMQSPFNTAVPATFIATDTVAPAVQLSADEAQIYSRVHYGFIAQELKNEYPNLVYENEQGDLSINYIEMIPLLVQSIQELTVEINRLKSKSQSPLSRSVDEEDGEVEDGLMDKLESELFQNTPNPFSDNTVIKYVIPQDAQNANLLIYDMNGKQIEQFVLTQKGMGSIVLEGSHLEAGMYLYSLIVDSKVIDVKRMILTN